MWGGQEPGLTWYQLILIVVGAKNEVESWLSWVVEGLLLSLRQQL